MKTLLVLGLVVVLGVSFSWAQDTPSTEGLKASNLPAPGGIDFKRAKSTFRSLLDPKRFSMSHTLGMDFGAGSYGGSSQYYLNTMTYQFTPNLTGVAQIGVQHSLKGAQAFGASGAKTQLIVPNFGLLYTPRPSMRFEFQMSQMPGIGPYGHLYEPSFWR